MLAEKKLSVPSRRRVAVVLNGHARRVSPKMVERVGALLPPSDLFVSHSIAENRAITRTIVERGYGAVLFGGGDGTFVQGLTDLRAQSRRFGTAVPSVGLLKLGTGNALAYALDAAPTSSEGLRESLERAADPRSEGSIRLLDVGGRLSPFAGVGLDVQILEDFYAFTRSLDRVGMGSHLSSGMRYALSIALRSTPRFLVGERVHVTAVNLGAATQRLGAGGRPRGPVIGRGEVIFQGPVTLAAGSSIPFFGLGMRCFPFADRRDDRFQLRLATCSVFELVSNLPSVWRGDYASETVHDYLVEEVELRFERPTLYQVGGDLQPIARDRFQMGLSSPVAIVH